MESPALTHLAHGGEQYALEDSANGKPKEADARSERSTQPESPEDFATSTKETWRNPAINIYRMAAVLLVRHPS